MRLSELVNKAGYKDDVVIKNEQEFDAFAAITADQPEKKLVFIKNKSWSEIDYSSIVMVITTEEISTRVPESVGLCLSDNPRGLFFALLDYHEKSIKQEKTPTIIGKNCCVAETARISPYNVVIGEGTRIDDYAVIEPNVKIGSETIIAAGAKIGIQGYNVYQFKGKTRQSFCGGNIEIGDNALIGTNTVVEQALYSYGKTQIGSGSYLAPNVAVQHNTCIGKNVEICCGVNIAGNVEIGDNSVIYVGANIANRIKIGSKAIVGIGSNVIHDIPNGATHVGNPAKELRR